MRFELLTIMWIDYMRIFSIGYIENDNDFNGALFHIQYDEGEWNYDVLWIKGIINAIKWKKGY